MEAERALSQQERDRTASDAFDRAVVRAGKQLVTALTLLRLSEKPTPPFFLLDHDALDDLLTHGELPVTVAFDIERAAATLRAYNAAAQWGNAKHPMTGATGPAETCWETSRDCVTVAWDTYTGWCGQKAPTLHPLVANPSLFAGNEGSAGA